MPVKVLFISSNPRGAPRLDLDEEHRALEEANTRNGRPFDHRAVLAARIEDLPRMLREHPPEIVHIAGHGQRGEGRAATRVAHNALDPMHTSRDVDVPGLAGADGSAGLLLRAADGSPELLPGHALTALFELLRDTVRLVVLNACYSDALAEAILPHAGCVIGSRFAISDAAAIAFARGFYEALGEGHSVGSSFRWGQCESVLRGPGAADTLVLRHRSDVDPDQRMLVRRGTPGNDLRDHAREISTRPTLPALKSGLHRFDLSAAVDACLPRILKQPHGVIGFAVHCPCDRFVKHLAERIKEGMRHVSNARVREISMVSNLRDMQAVWRRLDEIRAVLQVQDVVCSVVIADAQTPAVLWDRISRDLQERHTRRFVLIIGLREDCVLPDVMRIPTPAFLYTHVLDWWQQVLQTRGWNRLLDRVLEASGVSLACSDAELDMDRVYDDLAHAMTVLQDNPDEHQFYADWIAPRLGAT